MDKDELKKKYAVPDSKNGSKTNKGQHPFEKFDTWISEKEIRTNILIFIHRNGGKAISMAKRQAHRIFCHHAQFWYNVVISWILHSKFEFLFLKHRKGTLWCCVNLELGNDFHRYCILFS
jgi:hypothetical protein